MLNLAIRRRLCIRCSSAEKMTFLAIGQLRNGFLAVNFKPNSMKNEKAGTNNFDCNTSCKLQLENRKNQPYAGKERTNRQASF